MEICLKKRGAMERTNLVVSLLEYLTQANDNVLRREMATRLGKAQDAMTHTGIATARGWSKEYYQWPVLFPACM
jgi:hypothetical protein